MPTKTTPVAEIIETADRLPGLAVSPEARDAIMQKVAALFPAHEIDEFTELFWQRIREWRKETKK